MSNNENAASNPENCNCGRDHSKLPTPEWHKDKKRAINDKYASLLQAEMTKDHEGLTEDEKLSVSVYQARAILTLGFISLAVLPVSPETLIQIEDAARRDAADAAMAALLGNVGNLSSLFDGSLFNVGK